MKLHGSDWCGIFHRFSYNNSGNVDNFSSAINHYEISPIGTSNIAYNIGSNSNVNNSKNGFIIGGTESLIFDNNRVPGFSENCFIFESYNSKIYEASSAISFLNHHMSRNGIIRWL